MRQDFLWGAATAAHQIEGNNLNSDWWARERAGLTDERSGDACDSYHRYPEDMELLRRAGLDAYRFSLEWARIEPDEGHFSRAELDHYRRMIRTAHDLELEPVVTLQHFTLPTWFADKGGFWGDVGVDAFARYVERCCDLLGDVRWVVTINEPNILNAMHMLSSGAEADPFVLGPDEELGHRLAEVHRRAVGIVRERTDANVGWSVAQQALEPTPGHEEVFDRINHRWEDLYLVASRGDDFIGVQSYTSQRVGPEGVLPHPPSDTNTLTGWAYRPDALEICLRRAWQVGEHTPLMVTENGIATADDRVCIEYTATALAGLEAAVADGIDVRGYLHWSALDNFEWGSWAPTFGLIAVDRQTFARTPKPSLAWLGEVASAHRLRPGARPDARQPQRSDEEGASPHRPA